MSADISKMFREVELHRDGRDLHRFLQPAPPGRWRHGYAHDKSNFWSHFLAVSCYSSTMSSSQGPWKTDPRAAKIVSNFYVDDCLTGAATPEKAMEIQEELISLLGCACIWLRKWRSNNINVLENIPQDMREDDDHQIISPPRSVIRLLDFIGIQGRTRYTSQLLLLQQAITLPRGR